MIKCSFPVIYLASYLNNLLNSISIAPPPGTIFSVLITLLTIIIASFKLLSASLINYSAPPLNNIVAVYDFGHDVKKLNLSAPTYFSSKNPHVPNISGLTSFVVD